MKKDQGTSSYKIRVPIQAALFPAVTICKADFINRTLLEQCNISFVDYHINGKYSNNDSGDPTFCRDPKRLYEESVKGIKEIISKIQIQTQGIGTIEITINDDKYWKIHDLFGLGRCLTFQADNELVSNGILSYTLYPKEKVRTYVHDSRIFKTITSMLLRGKLTEMHKFENIFVNYDIFELIDSRDRLCVDESDYNFDQCNENYLYNKLVSKFGCTVPSLMIKDKICKSQNLGYQVFYEANDYYYMDHSKNNGCNEPCNFISVQLEFNSFEDTTGLLEKFNLTAALRISFKQRVTKVVSYYLYDFYSLFAEIGGLMGLFTGLSLYNFLDIFVQFYKWFKIQGT